MQVIKTPLQGLIVLQPQSYDDERGFFLETFQKKRYQTLLNNLALFVQDNFSRSKKHVLRGLHYQKNCPQDKLVMVTHGCVFDVAVDIRIHSETFGEWFGIELSDENHKQLFIPQGFAHGFCVLSDYADFYYKCSDFYNPNDEQGILWCDSTLNIDWPITSPCLSKKDSNYAQLEVLLQHNTLY